MSDQPIDDPIDVGTAARLLDRERPRLRLVDRAELVAEGFPDADPLEWRRWWAKAHGYPVPVDPALEYDIECRRIEWRYL